MFVVNETYLMIFVSFTVSTATLDNCMSFKRLIQSLGTATTYQTKNGRVDASFNFIIKQRPMLAHCRTIAILNLGSGRVAQATRPATETHPWKVGGCNPLGVQS